jgi:hypothetical protein
MKKSADSQIVQIYREAMRIWGEMKAQGVPLADRVNGLAKTLRTVWPQTREWKYLCQACSDYGLRMSDCPGDATCGRLRAHLPHEFGTPCWCSAGVRFKAKPKTEDDALAIAAKTAKPKGFTRAGR